MADTSDFSSLDEATEILALPMRRWNDSVTMLNKDEVYVPHLPPAYAVTCTACVRRVSAADLPLMSPYAASAD